MMTINSTVLSKVLEIWLEHYLKIGDITLRKISYDSGYIYDPFTIMIQRKRSYLYLTTIFFLNKTDSVNLISN